MPTPLPEGFAGRLSVWRGVLLCAPSDVQDVLSPSKNLLPLTWALRAHTENSESENPVCPSVT